MNKDIVDIVLITLNAVIVGYLFYNCIEIKRRNDRNKLIEECKELCENMIKSCDEMLKICEEMRNALQRN